MDVTPRLLDTRRRLRTSAAALTTFLLAGCVGGSAPMAAGSATGVASDATWRALAHSRVTPLDGAVRIAIGDIEVPDDAEWDVRTRLPLSVAFSEIVAAGLLRRADVHFVERRRFTAAVDAERLGQARSRNAPPVGRSPGAELILEGSFADFGGMATALELRLVDAQSGAVRNSWRTEIAGPVEPVGLARTIVGSLMAQLAEAGRRPTWSDTPSMAPTSFTASGVTPAALSDFLRGLGAEERWDWEAAREGYQAALASAPDFLEAEAALARTARLRNGGSLGAS